MNFNLRMKELRLKKRLTMEELAHDLDLSSSMIGFYERGTKLPEVRKLVRIAEYFNVSVDYLLGLDIPTKNVDNINPEVCKKIHKIRMDRGYTIKEFADYVDISKKQLIDIENGIVPDINVIVKISTYLNININTLIGDTCLGTPVVDLEHEAAKEFASNKDNLNYMKLIMKMKKHEIDPDKIVLVTNK